MSTTPKNQKTFGQRLNEIAGSVHVPAYVTLLAIIALGMTNTLCPV